MSDGSIPVAFMGIIDDTVKSVVGIANHQAVIVPSDIELKSILVIICNVFVLWAEWGIMPNFDTGFIIRRLSLAYRTEANKT